MHHPRFSQSNDSILCPHQASAFPPAPLCVGAKARPEDPVGEGPCAWCVALPAVIHHFLTVQCRSTGVHHDPEGGAQRDSAAVNGDIVCGQAASAVSAQQHLDGPATPVTASHRSALTLISQWPGLLSGDVLPPVSLDLSCLHHYQKYLKNATFALRNFLSNEESQGMDC